MKRAAKTSLEKLSCRERVELLCDYLDRELPAAQRRLVEEHRRSCRSCAALLRSLTRTARALRALKTAKPPASARQALLRSLKGGAGR